MPQVYTLRAPENFNYTDGHHSPAGRSRDNQNYEHRGTPSPSLKSTNYLQLPSSPMHSNSNPRATTAAVNKKRRSPILQREKTPTSHLNELDRTTPEYNRRSPSPKSHGVATSSHSSSRKLVTIYTITSPNDDPFLSQMPRTPPPPISQHRKTPFVSFDRAAYHNEYDALEEAHYPSKGISSIPVSQSKALQSIERSMNLYRFRRY